MRENDEEIRPDQVVASHQHVDATDDNNNDGTNDTAPTARPQVRVKEEIMSDVEEDSVMQDAAASEQDGGSTAENSEQQDAAMAQAERQQRQQDKRYKKANKLKFYSLCNALEQLWAQTKSGKRRWSTEQKLEKLLPQKLIQHLDGGDAYPLLRLIMPEIDTSRYNLGMLEKNIASAWTGALGMYIWRIALYTLRSEHSPSHHFQRLEKG